MTPWGAVWRLLLVAAWVWSLGKARDQGREETDAGLRAALAEAQADIGKVLGSCWELELRLNFTEKHLPDGLHEWLRKSIEDGRHRLAVVDDTPADDTPPAA